MPNPAATRTVSAHWCREQAAAGHRVLAVAEAPFGRDADDALPSSLRVVGAVAMTDPPREGIAEVVNALTEAGIRMAVMTGDQPATAATIARQVGVSGPVLDVGDGLAVGRTQRGRRLRASAAGGQADPRPALAGGRRGGGRDR